MKQKLIDLVSSVRLGFAGPEPQLSAFYAYKHDAFTEMLGALYVWETLRARPIPIDEQERYALIDRIARARERFESKLMLAAVVADESAPFNGLPESYTYRGMLDLCRRDLKIR